TFLHRHADPGGLQNWVSAMTHGVTQQQVILGMVLSPEYQAAHSTDLSFVNALYTDVLKRSADAPGLANWLQALQTGASRPTLAQGFVYSAEVSRTVIDAYYHFFLRRRPNPAEEQFWLNLVQAGRMSLDSVAQAILSSPEYFA